MVLNCHNCQEREAYFVNVRGPCSKTKTNIIYLEASFSIIYYQVLFRGNMYNLTACISKVHLSVLGILSWLKKVCLLTKSIYPHLYDGLQTWKKVFIEKHFPCLKLPMNLKIREYFVVHLHGPIVSTLK